jgi:hypothetical protein
MTKPEFGLSAAPRRRRLQALGDVLGTMQCLLQRPARCLQRAVLLRSCVWPRKQFMMTRVDPQNDEL